MSEMRLSRNVPRFFPKESHRGGEDGAKGERTISLRAVRLNRKIPISKSYRNPAVIGKLVMEPVLSGCINMQQVEW